MVSAAKRPHRKQILIITSALCVILVGSPIVSACQVPVFRYALERWNPDRYEVYVLHDAPLDQELIDVLRLHTKRDSEQKSPINLKILPGKEAKDSRLRKLWMSWPEKDQPLLAVFYPPGSDVPKGTPAYAAVANSESVASLFNSPVRQAIAKRLTKGDSAVWIFVSSGDKKQDQAAYDSLEKQLKLDEQWLKLPSPKELEIEPERLEKTKIKLQIKFSIVKLDRNDKAESFLVDALLNSESDLRSFNAPLAFPVFGRGRVLYGLVGKGIMSDTIRSASSFMAGPCSCQVKNQNPGFDLLLTHEWDKAVGDTLISSPIEGPKGDNLEPTLLTIPPGRSSKGR